LVVEGNALLHWVHLSVFSDSIMPWYSLKHSPAQQILTALLLMLTSACSPDKRASKPLPVPDRLKEIHQISQQTSYPLFDCDTTKTEIRLWESASRLSNIDAIFLQDHTVFRQTYYLKRKNSLSEQKVIATITSQEQIIDRAEEKEFTLFKTYGGLGLTLHKGAEAAIDSLFQLSFANMQSQSRDEELRVGDGISYIIEVRRGGYYKYVYYHSPEYFKSEPAQQFVRVWRFLTSARFPIPKYQEVGQAKN
jgi:hypothetical protein